MILKRHIIGTLLIAMFVLCFGMTACVPEIDTTTCKREDISKGDDQIGKKTDAAESEASDKSDKARLADWKYTRKGKKNPFKPMSEVESFEEAAQWDVEQMTLYGTVIAKERGESVAFILLPDGDDLIVREGDAIGKQSGVVKQIREDAIVVEEVFIKRDPKDKAQYIVVYWEKTLPLIKVIE